MEIKAADVMKLRKMTGAGMMDCKKALIEAEGDFARAQDIIREKGKLVVAKRADRTATEGVVVTKIVGQKAYILCLACETDFVAQNAEYTASAEAMLEVAVNSDAADRDALMAAKNAEGHTVEEMVTEKSAISGKGTVSVKNVYAQGGCSSIPKTGSTAGKAIADGVTLAKKSNRTLLNGKEINDNYGTISDLYWSSITKVPDVRKYVIEVNGSDEEDNTKPGGSEDKPSNKPGDSGNNSNTKPAASEKKSETKPASGSTVKKTIKTKSLKVKKTKVTLKKGKKYKI